jgi:hypothetical protein
VVPWTYPVGAGDASVPPVRAQRPLQGTHSKWQRKAMRAVCSVLGDPILSSKRPLSKDCCTGQAPTLARDLTSSETRREESQTAAILLRKPPRAEVAKRATLAGRSRT